MEQEIKNEDVKEEIVNEEQETTAEEQVAAAETKDCHRTPHADCENVEK